MSTKYKTFLRIISGVSLLSFGGALCYLFFIEKLAYYVFPTHIHYVVLSSSLLLLMGMFLILDKNVHVHSPNKFALGALFLPVFLVLLFPPKALSGDTALLRGLEKESLPVFQNAESSFSFTVDPEHRKLIDWAKTLALYPEPKKYVGQKVRVQGFIVPTEATNVFLLTQFYISCCAADARPIALPVEYDPKTFTPKKDQWIEMEGVMKEGLWKEERKAIIEMKTQKEIPVPAQPYAY